MKLNYFFLLTINELFSKYNLLAWFESLINIVNVLGLIDITKGWAFNSNK
jgi:hypothetical protein